MIWEVSNWLNEHGTVLSAYMPHAMCILVSPVVALSFIIANVGTALAYLDIGKRFRRAWKNGVTVTLMPADCLNLAIFIILCGLSHLTHMYAYLSGDFILDVIVTSVTCVFSVVTAFHFYRVRIGDPPSD